VAREREQDVLRRDVLVVELARLVLGGAQDLQQLTRGGGLGGVGGGDDREAVERGVEVGADVLGTGARLAQHGDDHALGRLEQHEEEVLGGDLGVAALLREGDGGLQGLL
jgi:hypothetical protein